jgi:hypothetical protein
MRNDQQARKTPRPRLAYVAVRSLSLLSHNFFILKDIHSYLLSTGGSFSGCVASRLLPLPAFLISLG